MKANTPTFRITNVVLTLLAFLALGLLGCSAGSNGVAGGSGYGDSAGPWPQGPQRTAAGTPGATPAGAKDESPRADVQLILVAKAPAGEEVQLDVDRVEVKFGDTWSPIVVRKDIADTEALPLRAGEKGSTFLLARTEILRKKYTHLRMQLTDGKSALRHETASIPLTLRSTTVELKDLKFDEKKPTMFTLTVDGTKVTKTGESATLPADAFDVAVGTPGGSIVGQVTPAIPNTRVELYWGTSKKLIYSVVPSLADGAFTVNNLPPGKYRVEVRAPGHHLADAPKDLIAVDTKVATLKPLTLTADSSQQ